MYELETTLETYADSESETYGRAFLRIPMDNFQVELGWPAFRLVAEDLRRRGVRPEELVWAYTEENYGRTVGVFEIARSAWRGVAPPRVGSIPPHTDAEFEGVAEVSREAARMLPRPAWTPERYAEILDSARKAPEPDWLEHDPAPGVTVLDPRPVDAPEAPKAVRDLVALAKAAGMEVRMGYSKGQTRAVKRGAYKRVQAYGICGLHPGTGWRFQAIHEHSPDLKGPWKWSSVSIWLPGENVAPGLGSRFLDGTVSDLKEWLSVSGSVGPAWFEGIHARVQQQKVRTKLAAQNRPAAKKHKEGAS